MAVRRAEFANDDAVPDWQPRPVRLDLLIVADGDLGFGGGTFGLSRFLTILRSYRRSWVRLSVTTAHRAATDPTHLAGDQPADHLGFTFSAPRIAAFDEIWLFGFSRTGNPEILGGALQDTEVRALAEFMQQGKGVFATGDHEDLGIDLCGRIPRVRSMRRWWFPPEIRGTRDDVMAQTGPRGEPMAPPGANSLRHDTNRPQAGDDPSGVWPFSRQSDAIPQPISLRRYSDRPRTGFAPIPQWPHPVLCSPRGPIEVLPDHPHEGLCERPTLVDDSLLEGSKELEYPFDPLGRRVLPEVIAWATTVAGHWTDEKPPVRGLRYGVIAAYEGSKVGVGRVLTDATWHHFVNVNLVGLPADSPHLRDIAEYFTNTAVWLAAQDLQVEMLASALYVERFEYPLAEEIAFPPDTLESILRFGITVRNALSQRASVCQTMSWAIDIVRPSFLSRKLDVGPSMLPVDSEDLDSSQDDVLEVFGAVEVAEAVLGGVMAEIVRRFPAATKETASVVEAGLSGMFPKAAQEGMKALAHGAAVDLKRCQRRASVLADAGLAEKAGFG